MAIGSNFTAPADGILASSKPWNAVPSNFAVFQNNGVYNPNVSCVNDFEWAVLGKVRPDNCRDFADVILTVSGVQSTGKYWGGSRTGPGPIFFQQDFPIQVTCGAVPNGVWKLPFVGYDAHGFPGDAIWELWSPDTFQISYQTICPDPNNPHHTLNCGANVPPRRGLADAQFVFTVTAEPYNPSNQNQGFSLNIGCRIKTVYSGRWSPGFILRDFDYDAVNPPNFFIGGSPTIPVGVLSPLYNTLLGILVSYPVPINPLFTAATDGLLTLPQLQAAVDALMVGIVTPAVQGRVDAAFAIAAAALPTAALNTATFGNAWVNTQVAPTGVVGIAAYGGKATIESAVPISDLTKLFNCLPPPPVTCNPQVDCAGKQPPCVVTISGAAAQCHQTTNQAGHVVDVSGTYEFIDFFGASDEVGASWNWGLLDASAPRSTVIGGKTVWLPKRYVSSITVYNCSDFHFGVTASLPLSPNPNPDPTGGGAAAFYFVDSSVAPFPCRPGVVLAPELQCLADFQSSSSSSESSTSISFRHSSSGVSSSSTTKPRSTSSHSSRSSQSRSSASSQSAPPGPLGSGVITGTFTCPLAQTPCGAGASVTIVFGGG